MNPNANSSLAWSWLRLARISALPSALSNILLGYLMTHGSWHPLSPLIALLCSSAALYAAGMILNDAFDASIDAVERPQRPIPSGKISRRAAFAAGIILLSLGIVAATIAGWIGGLSGGSLSAGIRWRPLVIAGLLTVCILLYDGWLKKIWIAPLLMGGCRTLNVLLGASTGVLDTSTVENLTNPDGVGGLTLGFPAFIWWIAVSIGVFIAGVTWLARKEASDNPSRVPLIGGGILITLGLAGIALVNIVLDDQIAGQQSVQDKFPWLIALIGFPIIRRVVYAVNNCQPATIQLAVVTCLRSIIILDAAVCFLVASSQPIYAIVVVALLVPSLILGRLIPPT